MRVLITGGAGFIGSQVADAHAARGDEVVVVDSLASGRREYVPAAARFYALDIRDPALREVFAPVTSSILTTLAAFLPLMLLPGIVGKFLFVIPFVVTLALLISLVEAFWMLPTHVTALRFRPARSRMQNLRNRFNARVRVAYSRALILVMRHRIWFGVGCLLVLGAAAGMAV
ncbi:MAG: NAD-dependent epimerase/dehydratase family protein, partial [Candidatus Rokubacteria bacterium]|nr:NAD-dependent epimerase/dehydratase family protein [Candidatus Rokubacteria bacterium]